MDHRPGDAPNEPMEEPAHGVLPSGATDTRRERPPAERHGESGPLPPDDETRHGDPT